MSIHKVCTLIEKRPAGARSSVAAWSCWTTADNEKQNEADANNTLVSPSGRLPEPRSVRYTHDVWCHVVAGAH